MKGRAPHWDDLSFTTSSFFSGFLRKTVALESESFFGKNRYFSFFCLHKYVVLGGFPLPHTSCLRCFFPAVLDSLACGLFEVFSAEAASFHW